MFKTQFKIIQDPVDDHDRYFNIGLFLKKLGLKRWYLKGYRVLIWMEPNGSIGKKFGTPFEEVPKGCIEIARHEIVP